MPNTTRLNRLRFRSHHRGMREMDVLMGGFADAYLGGFTAEQLDAYEAILEMNDWDVCNWITGAAVVPVVHDSDVMRLLLEHGRRGG